MIYGFFGLMSSGKGVLSTAFLRWLYSNNPKKIISNCWLNNKMCNYEQLTTEELVNKSKEPEFFRNSYLYITELHTILESRKSSATINTQFTSFLTQVGKLSCTIVYDSQLIGQIDIRMREFTPYRFVCSRYKIVDEKIVPVMPWEDRIIKEQIAIKLEIQLNDTNTGKEQLKHIGFYVPTQQDFDFYKTREIITLDRDKFLKK